MVIQRMFSLFFKKKPILLGFEDIQFAIQHPEQFILLNTLSSSDQACLLLHTVLITMEETVVNDMIANYDVRSKKIIVYGRNATDETANAKCEQLLNIGFQSVYLYAGGMFEWLLLQDVYGREEFPTTSRLLDILKFKPTKTFGGYYLT